jgi:outer membrane protein OmpA-like peptidoglycan-associated protein
MNNSLIKSKIKPNKVKTIGYNNSKPIVKNTSLKVKQKIAGLSF